MPAAACTSGSITNAAIRWCCCGQHASRFVEVMLAEVLRAARPAACDSCRGRAREASRTAAGGTWRGTLDPADAHAAERVAVIGVAQGHVAGLFVAAARPAPHCRQYWNAIFSATSTAVAPSSEKKTCRKPGGARSTSRLASRIVVGIRAAEVRHVRHFVELLRAWRRRSSGGGGRGCCTTGC